MTTADQAAFAAAMGAVWVPLALYALRLRALRRRVAAAARAGR